MAGVNLLDRIIGGQYPSFATETDVRAFEEFPYTNRIGAESTYDAIRLGAAYDPDALAIQYLTNADPADQPIVMLASRSASQFSISG
jgi:fatty-acyl-CoA synthase